MLAKERSIMYISDRLVGCEKDFLIMKILTSLLWSVHSKHIAGSLKRALGGIFLLTAFVFAQPKEVEWPFLNITRIGAKQFIQQNPAYNGKDVVIFILDTGVDMGVRGLQALPEGGAKVIDVQDFSGEGDVWLEVAEKGTENGEFYLSHHSGAKLFGYKKLNLSLADSAYYIGVLEETRFQNSVITDINNNGKLDDIFSFIVVKENETIKAYIDLDGDGNIDDESPHSNYKDDLKPIQFRGRDIQYDKNLATFGLNIFYDEQRVNFHFDGSSHGTHVAGISAGYKINGQDGYNGIAPGAKIISLKIGDGRLSGGATTTGSMLEAYEYGANFAKTYDGPVVFNMSFGVGSEIEGHSDIAYLLEDMLDENPELIFCTSAGNEGPGISTVGLPSASPSLLSVGAVNAYESARDVYGGGINEDKIFVFSSRGGEVNKPDIVAPGSAASTVPGYELRENMWGTSMASPQAAGAAALIFSAVHQQTPAAPISGAVLKRALQNGAKSLNGYQRLEQGDGVINVSAAFELYMQYINSDRYYPVVQYQISTLSPVYESEEGESAYWRFGDYMPNQLQKQRFEINAVFPKDWDAEEKHNFYRGFNLYSKEPWIRFHKSSTYIKGAKSAVVDVWYDPSKMKTFGLYNGVISAFHKGNYFSGNSKKNKAFDLSCTVVKPIIFHHQNNYSFASPPYKIAPGDLKRIFFEIPVGASSMSVRLGNTGKNYANIQAYLHDPDGRQFKRYRLNTEKQSANIFRISQNELKTGVWELALYADFRNEKISHSNVTISFSGLEINPSYITSLIIENGEFPRGSIDVTNRYQQMKKMKIGGSIKGFRKTNYLSLSSEFYEKTFSVDDHCEKVEFDIELSKKVYNYFTDFAINIKDINGKSLKTDGLSYRKTKLSFTPPASGKYTLELIPAFAHKFSKDWDIKITESYIHFKKPSISGYTEAFYPNVKKRVNFTLNQNIWVAPSGFSLFGELYLQSVDIDYHKVIVPIEVNSSLN
jgi:subtilisin family serine protease